MKAGKSSSDTSVLVKGSTHSKAVSSHRLDHQEPQMEASGKSSLMSVADSVSDTTTDHLKNIDASVDSRNVLKYSNKGFGMGEESSKLRQRKPQHGKEFKSSSLHDGDLLSKSSADDSCQTEDIDTDDISMKDEEQTKVRKAYYLCWMILTLLSLLTRLYNIEIPAHICWDETHFGKMGSWYINRTFFFDVHPPLGKMLIGMAGLMTGYDGSFHFQKPGDPYMDTNYVGMRVFCAILGSLLVPLTYQCVWILTHSILAAIFASALILFDTGNTTLSRHILLDPILMFFIMVSTFTCLKFLSHAKRPFSLPWWLWLSACGISLAGAIGVKFVGLFVILFVGYTTAADLWNLLSNLSLSMAVLFKHVVARAMCLIGLPVLIYMLIFAVHFKILNHSGNGDGFFSSGFQSQLIGNRLYNVSMPQYIAYGSEITLKQRRTGGAYLHSHPHLYPEEHPPKQQQVTSYSHKDDNNRWLIKPADRDFNPKEELAYIHSGDLVRLEHTVTRRNLHSHKEQAPLSKHHFQVSGYGQNGSGDANDIWQVEVVGATRGDKIQTVRSKIRIIHYHVQCLLHSHDKKLPKWGWEQLEVTCNPNMRDTTSAWSVEEVVDARLPNVSFEVYSPSFVEKFLESHAVMTQGNSGLKPKEGEITSRPWQWPIDYRGQVFSGLDHRIYMLGNPVIFWSLLGLKAIFLLLWMSFSISRKRNIPINENLKTYCENTFKVCWWLLLAWFLHYAPFWGMSRVLYFHHYFPAFLFSAMFGGVMLDFLVTLMCVCLPERLAVQIFYGCLLLVASLIFWSFYLFHPLVYGMSGPMAADAGSQMHRLKWMDSWDI